MLQLLFLILLPAPALAESARQPADEITGYDLVNAVNALRAAFGLPLYSMNAILMSTAQNQADFMATSGQVTHTGPGGITLTQRLLAAGYPLGGDLSLGGFRAENITTIREGMTAESAVDDWMGDALHQNTMLSADLTEIGAGVALANGRVYLVIDAARPVDAPNVLPVGTAVVESGPGAPTHEALVSAVSLSTPNANGEVIHEVRYGQTLWRLAISYGVKIDEIKQLNGLVDNLIYPGDRLIIKIEPTQTPVSATATVISTSTVVQTPTSIALPVESAMPTPESAAPVASNVINWVIGIIALAVLGGAAFAWLGSRPGAAKNG
jgi:LysM repeat protein